MGGKARLDLSLVKDVINHIVMKFIVHGEIAFKRKSTQKQQLIIILRIILNDKLIVEIIFVM